MQAAADGGGQRERRRRTGADQRAQHERAHPIGHALRAEDVRGVDHRRREAQHDAEGIERPRPGAREDEDETCRGDHERGNGSAVRQLTAEHDRGDRDHRGERVEQQGEQRRVEALEGAEEGAGLGAVADAAERQGDGDVPARESAQPARRARGGHQHPEQRGGHDEPHGQQRTDGRALVVGELAEDRHPAERDRGGEAEEGADGGHGPILPGSSFRSNADY